MYFLVLLFSQNRTNFVPVCFSDHVVSFSAWWGAGQSAQSPWTWLAAVHIHNSGVIQRFWQHLYAEYFVPSLRLSSSTTTPSIIFLVFAIAPVLPLAFQTCRMLVSQPRVSELMRILSSTVKLLILFFSQPTETNLC